jgi:hypothetical protein
MTEPPSPLRILHLITSLNPAGGGPAEGLRNIILCSIELGAVPTIVTLDAPHAPCLDRGHVQAIGLEPGRASTFSYAAIASPADKKAPPCAA